MKNSNSHELSQRLRRTIKVKREKISARIKNQQPEKEGKREKEASSETRLNAAKKQEKEANDEQLQARVRDKIMRCEVTDYPGATPVEASQLRKKPCGTGVWEFISGAATRGAANQEAAERKAAERKLKYSFL